jgi:hypothetical protein
MIMQYLVVQLDAFSNPVTRVSIDPGVEFLLVSRTIDRHA